MRRTLFACAVTAIVTTFVVGGVAWALQSPVDGNGVIHGCYNPTTGALKLDTKGACPLTGAKTPITWNAQGPQGAQGTPGADGQQGPAGPQGRPGVFAVGSTSPFVLNLDASHGAGQWFPVADATETILLDQSASVLARFSGNSEIEVGCSVRLLVDGSVIGGGPWTVNVSVSSGGVQAASNATSIERLASGLAAGSHVVSVEASVSNAQGSTMGCFVPEWTLVAETLA
jgi:hypothetical protein